MEIYSDLYTASIKDGYSIVKALNLLCPPRLGIL